MSESATSSNAAHSAAPVDRRSRVIPLVALLAVAFLLPLARPLFAGTYNYVLQLLFMTYMWVALTSSWNIIGGYVGYISLGNNVFIGIGAYFSGAMLVYYGWSPFLTAPLAGVLGLGVGLLFGLVALRTSGAAFIISTIAMLLMTALVFDNWEWLGGANGLSLPLVPIELRWVKVPFYYAMLLTGIGAVWLSWRVAHSRFGLGLRAIAEDEIKAEVAGINTRAYKVMAFALSAIFPAIAGALWGYSLTYLRGTIFFSIAVAAEMVLMAIIGGRGTVTGPVVGAVLLVAINEFSVAQFGSSELNIVVTGLILLTALMFFPTGIVGSLRERGRLPPFLDWD